MQFKRPLALLLSVSLFGCEDTKPAPLQAPADDDESRDFVGQIGEALAQAVPAGFQEELFLGGRSFPTALRFTPQGIALVAEKGGRIYAYGPPSNPGSPRLVVDLNAAVHNFWDRGLLGLAVDPQFPSRPYLYVLYTFDATSSGVVPRWGLGSYADDCPNPPGATDQGCVVYGRLSRITVDPATLQGVETPLLSGNWCQQYPSHSVGDLTFGRDGMLYVTGGDGASFNQADWGQFGNPCGDPTDEGGSLRSQDLLSPADVTSYDGTLLRLDVSTTAVSTPSDNPLVGNAIADDDYIVAMGLRNPFRITARPGTDEIWIADVGWNDWEEINRVDSLNSVTNFGWPCYEGAGQQSGYASRPLCQQLYAGTPPGIQLRTPYYAYQHSANVVAGDGCGIGSSSITGVAFNSASVYPSKYADALFFADASRRCVWTMFAGASGHPDSNQREVFVQKASGQVVDIQMGPDGFLYYVDIDGGNIYRIAYYPANVPPQAQLNADPTSGPTPLLVHLDASASMDAEDGTNLNFAWDLDADGAFDDGSGGLLSTTLTTSGNHTLRVQVTDSAGASSTASVVISADNSPPVPEILTPSAGTLWSVGDVIAFSGQAIDPETGIVPASQMSWEVIMLHCSTPDDCHEHPITTYSGIASGTFTAVDHEYPAHLELRLTAVDDAGSDWALPGWQKRLPLRVSGAFSGGPVSDIPVLVQLDPSRIDYASTALGGADVRVTSSTGQLLSHDIDTWNPSGVSTLWVKLPALTSASGSNFFVYYDNHHAALPTNQGDVWSNGYAGVWHMSSGLVDATDGVSNGAVQGATASVGRFGAGYFFDGVSSFLDVGNAAELNLTTHLSVEAWFRVGSTTRDAYDRIVSNKSVWDAAGGFNLEVQPALGYLGALGGGGDYLRATGVTFDTQWHFAASSISGTSGSLFLDGRDITTDASLGTISASTLPVNIGRRAGGGDYFLGDIDEVRLSSVARSAAWFSAQDLSMRDQLFSYGAPEQPSVLGATASVVLMPETVDVAFQTEPPGLGLSVGSQSVTPPYVKTAINYGQVSVGAPATQTLGGTVYVFSQWSDGGAIDHALSVYQGMAPAVATYVAVNVSCSDGAQNGAETGIDCGGSCDPCAVSTSAVWLEAESGVLSGTPTFLTVSESIASSGQAIEATANNVNSTGSSRATFTVNVAAGTYALWGRVHAPTAAADSFWVSVDGNAFIKWNNIPHSTLYIWDRVRNSDNANGVVNYALSAGIHTIVIANREDGARLDRLYLTANGDKPSGLGGGTCSDGIQNQGEKGVDCGGSCPFCPVLNAFWLEAESGARSGSPTFQLVSDASASGGTSIQASANSSNAAGVNRATFTVNAAAGTYALWGRVRAPTADDDSFWVSVDGSSFIKWNNIPQSTSYTWNRVRNSDAGGALMTYTLGAGGHSIVVANREDGTQLDKLYLTARFDIPSGLGL